MSFPPSPPPPVQPLAAPFPFRDRRILQLTRLRAGDSPVPLPRQSCPAFAPHTVRPHLRNGLSRRPSPRSQNLAWFPPSSFLPPQAPLTGSRGASAHTLWARPYCRTESPCRRQAGRQGGGGRAASPRGPPLPPTSSAAPPFTLTCRGRICRLPGVLNTWGPPSCRTALAAPGAGPPSVELFFSLGASATPPIRNFPHPGPTTASRVRGGLIHLSTWGAGGRVGEEITGMLGRNWALQG